jgi:heme/copper-type cytochrome/quinol oxidase subunit 2
MLVSLWALALTALFVLGVYWCCEVVCRFREDLQELREVKEAPRKAGIIIVWVVTVVIAVILIISFVVIIGRFTGFVLGLL